MNKKYLKVPIELLKVLNTNDALVLSYIRMRAQYFVNFVESNEKIARNLGLSISAVTKIMRKLKKEGHIGSLCKRHSEVIVGVRNNVKSQETITDIYLRIVWLTKKGEKYYD